MALLSCHCSSLGLPYRSYPPLLRLLPALDGFPAGPRRSSAISSRPRNPSRRQLSRYRESSGTFHTLLVFVHGISSTSTRSWICRRLQQLPEISPEMQLREAMQQLHIHRSQQHLCRSAYSLRDPAVDSFSRCHQGTFWHLRRERDAMSLPAVARSASASASQHTHI